MLAGSISSSLKAGFQRSDIEVSVGVSLRTSLEGRRLLADLHVGGSLDEAEAGTSFLRRSVGPDEAREIVRALREWVQTEHAVFFRPNLKIVYRRND